MNTCCDCKQSEGTQAWGWPVVHRCDPCSEAKREKIRQERMARDAAAECDVCGKKTGCRSFSICVECCEEGGCHEFDPDEGFECLHCGKNGFEDVVAAAESRAEGDR